MPPEKETISDASVEDYPFKRGRLPDALKEKRYYPYHKLGTEGRMPQEMDALAHVVGADGGDNLVVVHRAKTEKIRKTGWHARVWKNYHKGLARQMNREFSTPECKFEAATQSHYVDESTFSISTLLRLCAGHVTHVLFFDEKKDRTVVFVAKRNAAPDTE